MDQTQTIVLYQPTLHAIAMKILKCRADAEDVVQETFIKWLHAEKEKIQNTKAYLVRSVINNCLNHLQAIKRKKEQYLESWSEVVEKFKESDLASIDFDLEGRLGKAFHLLQHRLEPLERAVFVLREAFDFDYSALQQLLGKKQDHCRQLFCRAKKKVQDEAQKLNLAISEKTTLMKSFTNSCDLGHASEFIAAASHDIKEAILRKF